MTDPDQLLTDAHRGLMIARRYIPRQGSIETADRRDVDEVIAEIERHQAEHQARDANAA